MTEPDPIEGALMPAQQPADIRYEDETASDMVTRVVVRVERADGTVKEYEAREPQAFEMNDPESFAAQVFRSTGLGFMSGGGFRGLTAGVPSVRLSFTAHPRHNLHITNSRIWGGRAV
jgi:hypothetical protein